MLAIYGRRRELPARGGRRPARSRRPRPRRRDARASLRSPSTSLAGLVIGYLAPPSIDPSSSRSSRRSPSSSCCSCSASSTRPTTWSAACAVGLGPADSPTSRSTSLRDSSLGLALGWDVLPALLLGGVTYISSSSIVAKVLDDFGRLGNSETPAVLSVLVIEDLAMAPYLPLVAVLLAGGSLEGASASPLAATALAVGRPAPRPPARPLPQPPPARTPRAKSSCSPWWGCS